MPIILKMKNIVFLLSDFDTDYPYRKIFEGKSSFEKSLDWAFSLSSKVYVAIGGKYKSLAEEECKDKNVTVLKNEGCEKWTRGSLVSLMAEKAGVEGAENLIFSLADRPFLDTGLSEKLLESHKKYLAEWTFADGYPEGFAPEIIDTGCLKILSELSLSSFSIPASKKADSSTLSALIMTDVNSFEVETVLAEEDYRMLRLNFSTSLYENFLASQNLFLAALENKVPFDAESLSLLASKTLSVQRTVPSFYNIQISAKTNHSSLYSPYEKALEKSEGFKSPFMSLENFKKIVDDAASYSKKATIGLSLWGECLLVPDIISYAEAVLSHKELSLLIETDGILLDGELVSKFEELCSKLGRKSEDDINFIVSLDARKGEVYSLLHPDSAPSSFSKAENAVSLLSSVFEGVYPQMLRMNENEDELESFYRYWSAKDSPSRGKVLIQKYDNFCGFLPDRKSADLSPLERNVCWHLKRDFCILLDGSVIPCRECIVSSSVGNVFEEGIEKIWKKMEIFTEKQMKALPFIKSENTCECEIEEKCGKCDEYYIFNF